MRAQIELGKMAPPVWTAAADIDAVGGCFVCFARGIRGVGSRGDRAWAAAVVSRRNETLASMVVAGRADAEYEPGMLALREGPLLETAVRGLTHPPAVLLVNATGRDHPRRAGLAVQLGAIVDLPTVGVTDRPLLAAGAAPGPRRGETSRLVLEGEEVARWVRTRRGARPLAVHAAWRTDVETATGLVLALTGRARTPEPIRRARHIARVARDQGVPPA